MLPIPQSIWNHKTCWRFLTGKHKSAIMAHRLITKAVSRWLMRLAPDLDFLFLSVYLTRIHRGNGRSSRRCETAFRPVSGPSRTSPPARTSRSRSDRSINPTCHPTDPKPKVPESLTTREKRERAMRAFRVTTTYKRIKKRQTHKTRSKTPKK